MPVSDRCPLAPQIEFVDALGQVAFAEELELSVTKLTPPPAAAPEAAPTAGKTTSASQGLSDSSSPPAAAEAVAAAACLDAASTGADAAAADAVSSGSDPRLLEVGTLRVVLKKGTGLAAVDLNGKSDPFAMLSCGDQEHVSSIKIKTCNPVWNEEMVLTGKLQVAFPPAPPCTSSQLSSLLSSSTPSSLLFSPPLLAPDLTPLPFLLFLRLTPLLRTSSPMG